MTATIEYTVPSGPRRGARRAATSAAAVAVAVALLAAPVGAATPATPVEPVPGVEPVPDLDLTRYDGRWLQLAATDEPFLEPCDRDVTATYTLLRDGEVRVVNRCDVDDGLDRVVLGRARVVGPAPSQLEVTFVRLLGWRFAFAGDYWVIGLGEPGGDAPGGDAPGGDGPYPWAVVGGPERDSAFVLSRTPTLPEADVERIVAALERNGYDPCDLTPTPTTGGERPIELCATDG